MFPCGWEGSILTPRDPWTHVFKLQPRVRPPAHLRPGSALQALTCIGHTAPPGQIAWDSASGAAASRIRVTACFAVNLQAYTAGLVSHNTKKYWKQFFEDELGPLPELVYTQARVDFGKHRTITCSTT